MASLGAAGGPTIISQTVVNIINLLDYKMSLDEALSSPRLHHQWKPDELRVEPLPADVQEKLKARGHDLIQVRRSGAAQVVLKTAGGFEAAHDPRLEGKAAGW
jgi:gamma-glutamyltranspeptidase/glutathione hydrolase